jgi:hypothetical protein
MAIIFCALLGAAANAQATRTWVSGVGDDVNPCSRSAPCKTFAGAISKTAAGGEIDALDPGSFGTVTINKSLTIAGSGYIAGVLASATNGITINDGGAGTIVVTLRNLDIEGLGFSTSAPGVRGIQFVSGAALQVENCVIRNFRDTTNGAGLAFTPSKAANLQIQNTIISGNGSTSGSTANGGIIIAPTGAGAVMASIDNVVLENNSLGIRADGTNATSGNVIVSVSDSVVADSLFGGLTAFTPSGGSANGSHMTLLVADTATTGNGTGLNSNGPGSTMRFSLGSMLSGNTTGVSIKNGGVITSDGTNQINDNTTPGSTLPIVGPS